MTNKKLYEWRYQWVHRPTQANGYRKVCSDTLNTREKFLELLNLWNNQSIEFQYLTTPFGSTDHYVIVDLISN